MIRQATGPRITFGWISSTVLEYSWKSTEKKKKKAHPFSPGPPDPMLDMSSWAAKRFERRSIRFFVSFFFWPPRDRKKHSSRSIRILKISVARIPTHANPFAKLLQSNRVKSHRLNTPGATRVGSDSNPNPAFE